MNLKISNTQGLNGKVHIPGSKSLSVRALFFALLAKGESSLKNILHSQDTEDARGVCEMLGANISMKDGELRIYSMGLPFTTDIENINTGNSGITTVFTLPLLGLRINYDVPVVLDCGEQMRSRPVTSLVNALNKLGMQIEYIKEHEQLPLSVKGQLKGGEAEIDGMNSQYLSSLLIALPCATNDSVITVRNLHERPYVQMTLDFLKQQKIHYRHIQTNNTDIFHIYGNQRYTAIHQSISGDFSSASCLIAAATLIAGEVELQGLDYMDNQGDKKLIPLLQQMGAEIVIEKEKIRISGKQSLTGMCIDASDIPDLVPALAVIGTQARGKTEIVNVKQARIKETDRIHSMVQGLKKMGAKIEEHDDGITIYESSLKGNSVNGYGDHRTVMALAIAGMLAQGETSITDGEAITKTYPQFVVHMQSLGGEMTGEQNKHIILIGFKHVGKSRIGLQLANMLNKKFIDLDREVEHLHAKKYSQRLTCRQIMQIYGEASYRELETIVLREIIQSSSSVISLGGGTSLNEMNQQIIAPHLLLHVIAPRGIVFERIMVEGRPAFFNPDEDPYESFTRLWNERSIVYQKLTPFTINNSETIDHAVNQAITHYQKNQENYVYA